MNEFVRPDKMTTIPITGGEMNISPAHDFIHYWPRIGAYILKYVDTGEDGQRQCNVPLQKEQAEWLIEECGMEQPYIRTFMGAEEHNHFIEYQMTQLDHLDFNEGEE